MKNRIARLRYLFSSIGFIGALKRIAAKLVSPIYYSETLVITNDYLDYVPDDRENGPGAVNAEVVTSVEELQQHRKYLNEDIDYYYLVDFLRTGTAKAYVSFLTYEDDFGQVSYIGFTSIDVGVFKMPEYNFGGPLSDHVEVGYEWEIVPEYRGRGFSYRGKYGQWSHREHLGATINSGVVRSHNVVSLRANVRQVPGTRKTLNGTFRMTRWLGGRWTRTPPWSEVRAMMESPPGSTSLPQW